MVTLLVVVDQVNVRCVIVFEAEDDPSIAGDGDSPESGKVAGEWMIPKSWQIHLVWSVRPIQRRQDTANPRNFMWREGRLGHCARAVGEDPGAEYDQSFTERTHRLAP